MRANQPPHERSLTPRDVITVAELATRLDKRLYTRGATEAGVHDGCVAALRQGVAAVITLPEHLEVASAVLDGSAVGLATAVGWHRRDEERLQAGEVVAEAQDLMGRGATEVAYIATAARLEPDDGQQVADHVAELVETATAGGVRVRTILATDDLTDEQIRRTCRDVAAAGAWMVQGGSWRARRAGLSRVEVIRAALPPEVLVKWTEPVGAVSKLLLCISLGVDRFNGDVDQLLSDASRAERLAPLTIPAAGVDYLPAVERRPVVTRLPPEAF